MSTSKSPETTQKHDDLPRRKKNRLVEKAPFLAVALVADSDRSVFVSDDFSKPPET